MLKKIFKTLKETVEETQKSINEKSPKSDWIEGIKLKVFTYVPSLEIYTKDKQNLLDKKTF